MSQPIFSLRDDAEPVYRAWDGMSQDGRFHDTKRPWCAWNEQTKTCDASKFLAGQTRYDWSWNDGKVGVSFENEG